MKTPSSPSEGPCIYCDKTTGENPEWYDQIPDVWEAHWSYAHTLCRNLITLTLEDAAAKYLQKDPTDSFRKVLARVSQRMADEVCSKVS